MENLYLAHHGVKGMKWGVRRYQNYDGSLIGAKQRKKAANKQYRKDYRSAYNFSARHPVSQYIKKSKNYSESNKRWDKAIDSANKAVEAEKDYKNLKKEYKIERKTQKQLDKSMAYDNKILDARNNKRTKIENKFDKKINTVNKDIDSYKPYTSTGIKTKRGKLVLSSKDVNSAIKSLESRKKELEEKKDYKLTDYDLGTKYVKQGFNKYNNIIKNYGNAKVSAIKNHGYNKSPEYRKAVKEYTNQCISNAFYYKSGTKLQYTSDYARANYTTDMSKYNKKKIGK